MIGREAGSRLFIVALSVVALSAILVLVDDPIHRVVLGGLLMGFLTWAASTSASRPGASLGPPPGVRERRRAHMLRRSLEQFLRDVRRLDAIARDVIQKPGPNGKADERMEELEKRLHNLITEISELAGRDL